jgi:hypothetical protein
MGIKSYKGRVITFPYPIIRVMANNQTDRLTRENTKEIYLVKVLAGMEPSE